VLGVAKIIETFLTNAERTMKNKSAVFLLSLLVVVAGCGKKSKKAEHKVKNDEISKNVDIPVAGDATSFFDSELGEYTLAEDSTGNKVDSDFTFEDADKQGYKTVYFDFNNYSLRQDQEENVAYDMARIKQSLADASAKGIKPVVIIEGHACHSAGSATYNLALSEKRAKVLSDRLIAQGIAPQSIKIVGRGKELPAMVDGKPCTGDREQQWPNRRDEVRVMFN
jgi:outer membrane protein OmpA-like peptidoglycan-associated protein